jgi:ABC-type glycerol-3-phosphate transport system permease component
MSDQEQTTTTPPTESEIKEARAALTQALQKRHARTIVIGVLVALVGLVISLISYTSAGYGETYTIFWGAVVFGGVFAIQGIVGYRTAVGKADEALKTQLHQSTDIKSAAEPKKYSH